MRVEAGLGESGCGAGCELSLGVPYGPQLGPIAVGLLEVVADDRFIRTAAPLEPAGQTFVKVCSALLWNGGVARVADEDVREVECILPRGTRAFRPNESLAHEPLENGAHLRPLR